MDIIKYEKKYAREAASVWNEVVEGGIAFPQENVMDEREADEFFFVAVIYGSCD